MEFDDNFFSNPTASSNIHSNSDDTTKTKHTNGGKSHSKFYVNNDLDSPDGFGDLPRESIAIGATSLAARESLVQYQLNMREKEYVDMEPFKIFVGTWNVNGQSPSKLTTENLRQWLSCDSTPPDMYAIGFQELDLSKEAFLFTDSPREEEWFQACTKALHPGAYYVRVKLIRLIGMMLVVFAKRELKPYIEGLAAETVGTGLLGKMGNKGGVGIRFLLHNTSFCFVNCHLAAHVEEYERRNQDYNDILARMIFAKQQKHIKDHEQIYWFGDLNYRITDMQTDQVKKLLEANEFSTLIKFDQLKRQYEKERVFVNFKEGDIRHMPTYKYDPGTDNWDSSEKNRPPAWCDRVLWRGEPTQLLAYRSHPALKLSDHKPVSALFKSSVKVTNQTKYRRVYEDVMKKLDKLENEFLPQVTVDRMEVQFEPLTFRDPVIQFLTIANTGKVPVRFEFAKKPNHDSYCKSWLYVDPSTASIIPGSKLDVELKIYVDTQNASSLNSAKDSLNDILVLHLEHGRDLFITVSGTYLPSCFGASIDSLVRLKPPVRETDPKVFTKLQKKEDVPGFEHCWDIPKEVWLLIDNLYKKGLEQEDLFQQPGLHTEFKGIRDALDHGDIEKLHGTAHSVAESLLVLLESFIEPVVPFELYQTALDSSHNFSECKKVITLLPDAHRHLFYYIIAFMKELLRHSAKNKLDQKILATVFGSILLRAPSEATNVPTLIVKPNVSNTAQQQIDKKKAAFIYHFLTNEYDI